MSHLGVRLLVQACSPGAEITSPGRPSGNNTLDTESKKLLYALQNDEDTNFKKLCNKTALQFIFEEYDGGKLLHVAARLGAVNCLQLLLENDTVTDDIEAPDRKGRTALLVAVIYAQSKVLRELLMAGANVNARDNDHRGVLHLLLLELSKNNKRNKQKGLMEVADVLLPISDEDDRPPPLDTLDLELHTKMPCQNDDATALSAAASIMNMNKSAPWQLDIQELCKKLIIAGAKYSEQDRDNIEEGINVGELLRMSRKPPSRRVDLKLIDEVCRGQFDLAMELLQEEEEAQQAINSWVGQYSLLFWVVDKNNLELVNMFLEKDANLRVGGKLPIERAAEEGFSSIFELLLEKMKPISLDEKQSLAQILEGKETDNHKACLTLIQDL